MLTPRLTITSIAAIAGMLTTFTASAMTEDEYNNEVQSINAKYQVGYDGAEKEGEDIKDESSTCLFEAAFDADWEITKVAFDVPEVTFKSREMSFDTLKVTVTQKTVAKTKVLKQYFENKRIAPGVIIKVPTFRWDDTEVKVPVPEFKWETTSFKTKIPEFKSKRVEWKFHILKIKKLKELNAPCKDQEERAQKLGETTQQAAATHKRELDNLTAKYLTSKAEELLVQMEDAERQFDGGLKTMDLAIENARKNGIDPDKYPVEIDGKTVTMKDARNALAQQKLEALASMKASHEKMVAEITALAGA